jgi:hypothetical protein
MISFDYLEIHFYRVHKDPQVRLAHQEQMEMREGRVNQDRRDKLEGMVNL